MIDFGKVSIIVRGFKLPNQLKDCLKIKSLSVNSFLSVFISYDISVNKLNMLVMQVFNTLQGT